MRKFNTSFVVHLCILGLTYWIWANASTEGLKFEGPSKWNSYEGFNLEHWMKGVVSQAAHIQAIHSQRLILQCMKLPGQSKKNTDGWTYNGWKINVCRMKGSVVHPVVWEHLCGIWKVPIVPNGVPRGKEAVGVWVPPMATLSLPWVMLMKDWVQKNSSWNHKWMEVEISSITKFFKLYMRGREAKSWGSIGAYRSLRSQSTTKIFLAHELMGGRSHHLSDADWYVCAIRVPHAIYRHFMLFFKN